MSVYYMGSLNEMQEKAKKEVTEFIRQGIPSSAACCAGTVVLGTAVEGSARLTVISLLSGSCVDELYMQCNRQSQKVKNLLACSQAEVAVTNGQGSVVLTCTGEVLSNEQIKADKWEPWMEQYHPQGASSPDYVVLHFITQSVRAMF